METILNSYEKVLYMLKFFNYKNLIAHKYSPQMAATIPTSY